MNHQAQRATASLVTLEHIRRKAERYLECLRRHNRGLMVEGPIEQLTEAEVRGLEASVRSISQDVLGALPNPEEWEALRDFCRPHDHSDARGYNWASENYYEWILHWTDATRVFLESIKSVAEQVPRETKSMGIQVDIGLVTMKKEEFEEVLKAFPQAPPTAAKIFIGERTKRHYNLRMADAGNGKSYRIAIVRVDAQGNGAAQNAARDFVEDLSPSLLLVVGIAGAIPKEDYTLGDIILSTRINDYTLHAKKDGGVTEYAITGGNISRDIRLGLANLHARQEDLGDWTTGLPNRPPVDLGESSFYGPSDWRAQVRKSLERNFVTERRDAPIFLTGTLGSSDGLIKEVEPVAQWLGNARDMLATEMESAGIYRGAEGNCAMLAIRGLSDVIGFKRDERWTRYACSSAAAFTRAYLRTTPVPISEEQSNKSSSGNSKDNWLAIIQEWRTRSELDRWNAWTSGALAHGRPSLGREDNHRLRELRAWLQGRIWPDGHQRIRAALANFAWVLRDFQDVFLSHAEPRGDELWAKQPADEASSKVWELHEEYVDLVQDLALELTRAANYVCDIVREELDPSFMRTEGYLMVMRGPQMNGKWSSLRVTYQDAERTEHPYPGLDEFKQVRATRDIHIG